MSFIDMTGQQFGEWTVLERSEERDKNGKRYKWVCRCSCGTVRSVVGSDLRGGKSVRCGASKTLHPRPAPISQEYATTHNSWAGMKQRCYYSKHIEFHRYGGRGIVVCDEWRDSFKAFLRDMGPKPPGTSLDRIDTDGPYCKANCRWATQKQQMSNTSQNVRVEYQGETLTLTALAEKLGLRYDRLHNYHRDRSLPLDEAIERCRKSRTWSHKRRAAWLEANGNAVRHT